MVNFNWKIFGVVILFFGVIFLISGNWHREFIRASDKTAVPEEFLGSLKKKFRVKIPLEYADRIRVLAGPYSVIDLNLPFALTKNPGKDGLYQLAPSFEGGLLDGLEEVVEEYKKMGVEIGSEGAAGNKKIMERCLKSTSNFNEFNKVLKALEKGLNDAKQQKDFIAKFMKDEFSEYLKVRTFLTDPKIVITSSERAILEARFEVLQKVFKLADKAEALADVKMQRAYLEAFGDLTEAASEKLAKLEKTLIAEANAINDELVALASDEGGKVVAAAKKLGDQVDDVVKQAAKMEKTLENASKQAAKCKGCGIFSSLKSKLISLGTLITAVDWGSKYSAGVSSGVELVKNKLEKAKSSCLNLETSDGLFTKVINFLSNYQQRYSLVTVPFIGEPFPTPNVPYQVDLNPSELGDLLDLLIARCPDAFREMMLTDDGSAVDMDFINDLSQLTGFTYYFSTPADVDKYLKESKLRREIKNSCNDPYVRIQKDIDLINNNPLHQYCFGGKKFDGVDYDAMEKLLTETYAYILRNDYSNSDRANEKKVQETAAKLAKQHVADIKKGKEDANICADYLDANGNLMDGDLFKLNTKQANLVEACNNKCANLPGSADRQLCYDLLDSNLSFDIADDIYQVKPSDVLSVPSL